MIVHARCSRCHERFETDGTVQVLWPPDGTEARRYPQIGAVCSIVCPACTTPDDLVATVNIPNTEVPA